MAEVGDARAHDAEPLKTVAPTPEARPTCAALDAPQEAGDAYEINTAASVDPMSDDYIGILVNYFGVGAMMGGASSVLYPLLVVRGGASSSFVAASSPSPPSSSGSSSWVPPRAGHRRLRRRCCWRTCAWRRGGRSRPRIGAVLLLERVLQDVVDEFVLSWLCHARRQVATTTRLRRQCKLMNRLRLRRSDSRLLGARRSSVNNDWHSVGDLVDPLPLPIKNADNATWCHDCFDCFLEIICFTETFLRGCAIL